MQVLSRLVPSIQSKSVSATTTRKLAAVVQQQNTMGRGSLRKIDHGEQCSLDPVCFTSSRKVLAASLSKKSEVVTALCARWLTILPLAC